MVPRCEGKSWAGHDLWQKSISAEPQPLPSSGYSLRHRYWEYHCVSLTSGAGKYLNIEKTVSLVSVFLLFLCLLLLFVRIWNKPGGRDKKI